MSEEDKLIQQELVDEIMKASEQFPNVILYMETVMESYEELEKENQQLKEVIDEVRELRDQFIDENELSVWENDSLINFVNKLLQILDKVKEN